MTNPKFKLTEQLWLAPCRAKSTKLCPVCDRDIVQGIYYVQAPLRHKIVDDGRLYSNDKMYFHPECFMRVAKTVKKLAAHNKKVIHDAELRACAENI